MCVVYLAIMLRSINDMIIWGNNNFRGIIIYEHQVSIHQLIGVRTSFDTKAQLLNKYSGQSK